MFYCASWAKHSRATGLGHDLAHGQASKYLSSEGVNEKEKLWQRGSKRGGRVQGRGNREEVNLLVQLFLYLLALVPSENAQQPFL